MSSDKKQAPPVPAVAAREEAKAAKQTRPGGAWRAFLHQKSKGAKFSKTTLQQFKADYAGLSPTSKDHFRQLGEQATQCRQAGGQGFPSYSRRASLARGLSSSRNDEAAAASSSDVYALEDALIRHGCTLHDLPAGLGQSVAGS